MSTSIIKQVPSPNFGSRYGYTPQLLVVHIMAGSLVGTESWFQNPASQVSSHYGIGLDGSVVQFVDESKSAWTEGNVRNPSAKLLKKILGIYVNPNWYSLSVENEGFDLSKAPVTQLNALTALLSSLCDKYHIPADSDHILGHFNIDSVVKNSCPSPDHTIMDTVVAMVQKLQINQNNNMLKFVKFYTSATSTYRTLFLESMTFPYTVESTEFKTSAEVVATSTPEVFIFWDNAPVGAGTSVASA